MKAPEHLQKETQAWFNAVVTEYVLEPHHVRLLTLAGESWDRCQQARRVIDAEGLTFADGNGAPRVRPEIAIERDSRLAFARLLRELDLDLTDTGEPSRPPPLRSNRRVG